MCAWKLAISLVDRGAGLSGKSVIFCCLGSDRADIGKALLRQRHASGDVAVRSHSHSSIQQWDYSTLLRTSLQPNHPPDASSISPKTCPILFSSRTVF